MLIIPKPFIFYCLFFLMLGISDVVGAAPASNVHDFEKRLGEAARLNKAALFAESENVLSIAKAQQNDQLLVDASLLCARFALDFKATGKALNFLAMAQDAAKNSQLTISKAYVDYILARCKFLQCQLGDAERLFLQAQNELEVNDPEPLPGYIQWGLGKAYFAQRQYVLAVDCYDRALELSVKGVDDYLRLNVLLDKGILLTQLANFPKAIEMHLLVNELANKQNNTPMVAASLNQVGIIYLNVSQLQKAQDAFFAALSFYQSLGDSVGMGQSLANLGELYSSKNMPSQSIDYSMQSLRINEDLKDTLSICAIKLSIGQVEFKRGQPQLALKQYMQASDLLAGKDDKSLSAAIKFNMGQAFFAMGNTASAIEVLNQAVETAGKLGERSLQAKCYNALSATYESSDDFVRALKAKNEFALLKDSILNEQTIEYVARMDAIYRSIQREKIIQNLKAQNDDVVKTLAKEKVTKLGFWLAIGVLVVVLGVLLIAFRAKQQAGKRLKEVNAELGRLNAAKDKFFSIISHDLKSPINSIMGFSEMIALHAEAGQTEKLVEFGNMVHQSTKKLYNLVDNLLLWSRTQVGATPYQPQQIDVGMQCQNIMSLLKLNAEEKDILIVGKLEKHLMAYADINLFNTILRNLISNAIKFSPVGATVTVSAKVQNKQILVSVADTGVGISPANLAKLFQIDSNVSTIGTFNEKGSGLGLVLCKEFVEINKGAIYAESEVGKGSVFNFTVPLAS